MKKYQYQYSYQNILDNPSNYSYSPFEGIFFIRKWIQQRDLSKNQFYKKYEPIIQTNLSSTDILLKDILEKLKRKKISKNTIDNIYNLIKSFEVRKRLYDEYDDNWRPINPNSYFSIERYLLFAEVLDMAWKKKLGIQTLNTLLKCLDILTALNDQLDSEQRKRLYNLIDNERNHIIALAKELGIGVLFDEA